MAVGMLDRLIDLMDGPNRVRYRALFCVLFALVAFTLPACWESERVFRLVAAVLGSAAFLLVRPSVPLKERAKMITPWSVVAPCLLIVYAGVMFPGDFGRLWVSLVYGGVFMVGAGTGMNILFFRGR